MESIYVIQMPNGEALAGTYEQNKAIEMCKALNEKKKGYTYRLIPFYWNDATEVSIISNAVIKP